MTMMIFALIRHGSAYLHLIPNPIQFPVQFSYCFSFRHVQAETDDHHYANEYLLLECCCKNHEKRRPQF